MNEHDFIVNPAALSDITDWKPEKSEGSERRTKPLPQKKDESLAEASVRRRAELYYQQLDALRPLHRQAKKELLAEGRKHKATKLARKIAAII